MTQVGGEVGRVPPVAIGRSAVAARFGTLVTSHAVIDVFPILITSLLWPLQSRLGLLPWQVTAILMISPIFSGTLQPVAAWLTDKYDTRLCGPLGLALGATCIGSIGLAQSFWQLIALQIVGVISTGMYHPISTALAGQSGARLLGNGRAQAIGVFIAAGMVGGVTGAWVGPKINQIYGMERLMWLIPPALLVAVLMHLVLRHARHRHDNHHELRASFDRAESRLRWRVVAILAGQNALRFTTNVGLIAVMFNVWAKSKVLHGAAEGAGVAPGSLLGDRSVDVSASVLVGHLSIAMTIGMGIGVLLIGRLVKAGRERGPLMYLSVIGAVFTAMLGNVGDAMHAEHGMTFLSMLPMYVCAALPPMGFFATFPIATSLAQRLQPGHTGFVTSLMMGAGWGFAAISAPLAVVFFGWVSITNAPALDAWRINLGFYGFAALLLVAGLSTLLIPKDLVARAAEHR